MTPNVFKGVKKQVGTSKVFGGGKLLQALDGKHIYQKSLKLLLFFDLVILRLYPWKQSQMETNDAYLRIKYQHHF